MDIYMPIFTDKAPEDVFWFRPVAPRAGEPIDWEDVVWLGNGFSIEEDGVDCYLAHFLERFFDADLPANQGREAYGQGFEWNLTHNFYTYATLDAMQREIVQTARQLSTGADCAAVRVLKQRFAVYHPCFRAGAEASSAQREMRRQHIAGIVDFYDRFVDQLCRTMQRHPETDLISIVGP